MLSRTAARGLPWLGIVGCAAAGGGGGGVAGEWAVAEGTRAWSFPRDHGAHPEYRTEWWYFTGILAAADGRRFGYQLTFFRQGIAPVAADPGNPWSVRDLYLAHFTLTDVRERSFPFGERVSRAGPGLAGAAAAALRCLGAGLVGDRRGERFTLEAREGAVAIRLSLRPRQPPVLHGDGGLSRKGPAAGQASWYASVTDLETSGTIRTADGTRARGPRLELVRPRVRLRAARGGPRRLGLVRAAPLRRQRADDLPAPPP